MNNTTIIEADSSACTIPAQFMCESKEVSREEGITEKYSTICEFKRVMKSGISEIEIRGLEPSQGFVIFAGQPMRMWRTSRGRTAALGSSEVHAPPPHQEGAEGDLPIGAGLHPIEVRRLHLVLQILGGTQWR